MGEPTRFELSCRGERIAGRLWGGPVDGERPLVIVTPALGATQHAPEVEALCRALSEAGLVAASLELPLHGERASPKLSARLLASARRSDRGAPDERLFSAFRTQVALELSAALDRLGAAAPPALAAVAFEPGAEIAAEWARRDARLALFQRVDPSAASAEVAARLCERLAAGGS